MKQKKAPRGAPRKKVFLTLGILLLAAATGAPTVYFFSGTAPLTSPLSTAHQPEARQNPSFEPIEPLPERSEEDPRIVALGKQLFHDVRLSSDNSISCASCHEIKKGGMDSLPRSLGVNKLEGPINAPTVLNAAHNFVQFWDGRAANLEEQALRPIENPIEMGAKLEDVIRKISEDAHYLREFNEIFGGPPTIAALGRVIATYERTLTTPDAPFDLYLKGNDAAITKLAKEGYALFKSYGCVACHQGKNVGGNMFQRFGIMGNYFADRGHITEADNGRFNVTRAEQDRHVFKVPSLRNVERTAPYFHDGSAKTLPEAVRTMAKYQLGRSLSQQEVDALVAFLHSLTGAPPE